MESSNNVGDKEEDNNIDNVMNSSGCCTPKAQRFRIPEMLACPAAPMKRRVNSSKLSSKTRSSIAFFAPPDLELFFLSLSKMSRLV